MKFGDNGYPLILVDGDHPFTEEHTTGMFGEVYYASIYSWKPKDDITVYELALCVPVFIAHGSATRMIQSLPECARRYFEIVEEVDNEQNM